jgi:hypothetical protein
MSAGPPHPSTGEGGFQTRRRLLAGGAAGVGAGLIATSGARAQSPPPVDDRYVLRARVAVNVKDYGAGAGGSNDTAAIQDAIDAGAGGAVFLPPGTYPITKLTIPSNTELFGAGWSSQLVVRPDADLYPLFVDDGGHDIRLSDFSVDGNKANISGDSGTLAAPAVAFIAEGTKANPCRRIYVDRLRVFNQKRLGIVFQHVQEGAVRDCTVEDNERDGITLYFDCRDIVVRGNTIARCGDDHVGINSEDGATTGNLCEGIVVAENTISGPGSRSRGPGITLRGGKDIVIAANVIRDVSQSGIIVQSINTTPATDVQVTGNAIYRPGQNGSADKWGIWLNSRDSSHVRRVSLVGNTIRATPAAAIALRDDKATRADGDIADLLIADNSLEDAGNEGIALGSTGINDVAIQGNRVRGSAGIGIASMSGAKRVYVRNNTVYRGGSYGIRLSIGPGGSCEGNQVYDDRGAGATQTHGIHLFALSGVWAFRDNTVWGNVTADYELFPGSHSATFDGPYTTLFGSTGWNPPAVADGSAATTTVPVPGASVGDPCTVGFTVAVPGRVLLVANVPRRTP